MSGLIEGLPCELVRDVYQREFGGRCDDLVEKTKDVELVEMEVLSRIEVAKDSQACRQSHVIEDACLGRRNRRCGRSVEARYRSKRRQVGDDELGGSCIDKALDVEGLINGRVDDIGREVALRMSMAPPHTMKRVFSLILGLVAR